MRRFWGWLGRANPTVNLSVFRRHPSGSRGVTGSRLSSQRPSALARRAAATQTGLSERSALLTRPERS
jgi:hypothetical protein